jgi:deazaflavin-dependent oxidoreductase (nitroreductase family)
VTDTEHPAKAPYLPPRWFVVTAWKVHRGLFRLTRGRRGLWPARPTKWGTMRLTATGRRSGEARSVILGYLEDGPDLVTLAMNGWGAAEPAWWLNLQAEPNATVQLEDRTHEVVAHRATGAERERLWARWREIDQHLDGFARRRPGETAVVVLSPRGR